MFVGARAVVRDNAGRVLLIRRSDNGQWALPAGAMELGESIADCAVREVREETGLRALRVSAFALYTGPDRTHTNMYGHTYQVFTTRSGSTSGTASWPGSPTRRPTPASSTGDFPPRSRRRPRDPRRPGRLRADQPADPQVAGASAWRRPARPRQSIVWLFASISAAASSFGSLASGLPPGAGPLPPRVGAARGALRARPAQLRRSAAPGVTSTSSDRATRPAVRKTGCSASTNDRLDGCSDRVRQRQDAWPGR